MGLIIVFVIVSAVILSFVWAVKVMEAKPSLPANEEHMLSQIHHKTMLLRFLESFVEECEVLQSGGLQIEGIKPPSKESVEELKKQAEKIRNELYLSNF